MKRNKLEINTYINKILLDSIKLMAIEDNKKLIKKKKGGNHANRQNN